MAKYRHALPQLGAELFMTDGGIETTLMFHEGQDLPHFAAFHLFKTREGRDALRKYYRTYAELAKSFTVGLILEAPTWRANQDWGERLGYDATALAQANIQSLRLLEEIRSDYETYGKPIVISGCIGPRGDGYVPDNLMSARDAESYHRAQIETFAATSADLVTALTLNYAEEAIGIVLAARRAKIPVVVSFTVETDGKLPTGQPLGDAIEQVDEATSSYPHYFMLNCAHPKHFGDTIRGDERWTARIRGLRANASNMSHAELNDAKELDSGNPAELGKEYASLKARQLRYLNVMGGCCGTDHRHIEQIFSNCVPHLRRGSS